MTFRKAIFLFLTILLAAGCGDAVLPPPPDPGLAAAAASAITAVPLGGRLSVPSAEISGLAWCGDTLLLLPQYPARFNQNLYSLTRAEILAYLDGQSESPLMPQAIPLAAAGVTEIDGFEGFEAIACAGDTLYMTIESSPGSGMMGYLVSGKIRPDLSQITLDLAQRVELPPQSELSNYSDEALLVAEETVVTIYEANGENVNPAPVARRFHARLLPLRPVPFPHIEYRITDATSVDENGRFWVINYLFPGDIGKLEPAPDPLAAEYETGATPAVRAAVERLVEFQYAASGITLTGTPPIRLALATDGDARNWEGIARLDDRGFLIVTDQFPETILAFVPYP